MAHLHSIASLLSLGLAPALSLLTIVSSATAQSATSSATCQNTQIAYAFGQWGKLPIWSAAQGDASIPPQDFEQMFKLLKGSEQNPRMAQIAIDQLTLLREDLQRTPALLSLIGETPVEQRSQLLPIVDQLVVVARALPPGYNYAQSRALITAAQAYGKLGQQPRSTPLLQQAEKTLVGIAVPLLKGEAQWRLSQAWRAIGQNTQAQASLNSIPATLKTLPPQTTTPINNLPNLLIDYHVQRGQWLEAEAAARSLAPVALQSEQLFRIAMAYLQAKQPKSAQALFEKTMTPLLKAPRSDQANAVATNATIAFAQAGGITTAMRVAQQIPSNSPALRVRLWLAIAGEARQQKRPTEATFAQQQLAIAGNSLIRQKQASDTLRDVEWSLLPYAFSRQAGYQPEMLQLIAQLKLKTEAVEFLITEAVSGKRFEEAQRLIPQPMMLIDEFGIAEVQDDWRIWVAVAAAQNGKPQQLIALSEEILPKVGSSDPSQLAVWSFPNDPPPLSNPPPQFLRDIRPAPVLPENRAIRFIPLLLQQGEAELAGRLGKALADQAQTLLDREPTVKLSADQHPLVWANNLEQFLRRQQQVATADRLAVLQLNALKQVEDLGERAALLPLGGDLRQDPRGAIATFIQLAQTLGVQDQPHIARRVFEAAVRSNQVDLMSQWETRAPLSPRERIELWATQGRNMELGYSPDQRGAIAWYDRAFALIQERPSEDWPNNSMINMMFESYLFSGQVAKARQLEKLIHQERQEKLNLQLNCLGHL